MYNSKYMTSGRDKSVGTVKHQGLPDTGREGVRQGTEDFQGSENALYGTTNLAIPTAYAPGVNPE